MKSTTKTHVAWLNTDQAADYLGFPSGAAFRRWLERCPAEQRPSVHWIGSRMRFRAVDLDKCVDVEPAAVPTLTVVRGGKR